MPTSPRGNRYVFADGILQSYRAADDGGITRVELARRLRIDEKEARRMLDPYHVITLFQMLMLEEEARSR
jgi:hypothetical protein